MTRLRRATRRFSISLRKIPTYVCALNMVKQTKKGRSVIPERPFCFAERRYFLLYFEVKLGFLVVELLLYELFVAGDDDGERFGVDVLLCHLLYFLWRDGIDDGLLNLVA